MSEWSQDAAQNLVLTTLYALMNGGADYITAVQLSQALGSLPAPRVAMILRTLERSDLAIGRHNAMTGSSYQISDTGYKLVEVAQKTSKSVAPLNAEMTNDNPLSPNVVIDSIASDTYDSSAWTGVKSRPLTKNDLDNLRLAINEAVNLIQKQDYQSNGIPDQALTFLKVAKELADVADPPLDIIWQLIERAGAICGIVGLFVSLFTAHI